VKENEKPALPLSGRASVSMLGQDYLFRIYNPSFSASI